MCRVILLFRLSQRRSSSHMHPNQNSDSVSQTNRPDFFAFLPFYVRQSLFTITALALDTIQAKSLAAIQVDGMFSPLWAQDTCFLLFFVIFVFILTRTRERNNLQSKFGSASLFCLLQLQEGVVVKVIDFDHFGCKIELLFFTNLTKNP